MDNKLQKNKFTYLQRIKQKVLVPWDSFSDFTYRFRDRVHTIIHGQTYYVCACMQKPAVSRRFKTFEDIIVAEQRRIGWQRSKDPTEIVFYHMQSPSLEPASYASLSFYECYKNQVYYKPSEKFGLEFVGDNDWCQIDEDKSSSRKLSDGRIVHSVRITRRATADTNGLCKLLTTLETFFLWTEGYVHDLKISGKIRDEEWDNPESGVYSANFIAALANRPISTTMLNMDCLFLDIDLNSKFCTFILDYIDFKMFSLSAMCTPQQKPYEIPDKLMNCEFLSLEAPLANAEILRHQFKGWGLVIKNPDPKLGFSFFYEVVMNWYNGKSSQWRYLSLACDVPECEWNSLIEVGIEVNDNPPENPHISTSEIEIKRADGEKCRILREDNNSKPTHIFFYFGKSGQNRIYLSDISSPPKI